MSTNPHELPHQPVAMRPAAASQPARRTPRVLRKLLSLEDFEAAARRVLPRPIFGYVSGGSERNVSLRGNRNAFDRYEFLPRVLVSTAGRNQKRSLFGHTYDVPFGFAPMGGTSLAAYQGDLVLARVAADLNMPMIQSGAGLTPLERVREAGRTAWFQAYLPGEASVITWLVERAARAGFETLVLTVDVPVAANRENNLRNGYSTPLRPTPRLAWDCMIRPGWLVGTFLRAVMNEGLPHLENMSEERIPILSRTAERSRARRDGLDWSHLALMRRLWKGRLVVKGLLDPADARIARESGVDGVIVSNHGGRQLDGTLAPLRALEAVVAEAGDMTVMMDSGIRRGTDVLKAIALGAQFVFVGRPFLYAAAIAGEDGVRHAVRLLRDEIDRNMAMIGVSSLAAMDRERLIAAGAPL